MQQNVIHTKTHQLFAISSTMKKRSERRKHCALALVSGAKNFRLTADPLPPGRRTAKI